jgi:hypothetical protein
VKRVLLLALLIAACSRSDTPSLDAKLNAELDRLDASLKAMPASSLAKAHAASIASARAAKTTDLRLYRMRDAWIGVHTLTFLRAHPAANKDLAAMTALWNERGPTIAKKPAVHGSVMQRALIEAAANRAGRFYRASLPYGKSSGAGDGLYYLAEADANARFADWVASLPGEDVDTQAYALEEPMHALESDMLKAFAADPSGKTTIAVSTRLKESRELHDQRLEDGAALMLVEARMRLDRANDETLPALFYNLGRGVTPRAQVAQKKPSSVKVTLVRWPYT